MKKSAARPMRTGYKRAGAKYLDAYRKGPNLTLLSPATARPFPPDQPVDKARRERKQ